MGRVVIQASGVLTLLATLFVAWLEYECRFNGQYCEAALLSDARSANSSRSPVDETPDSAEREGGAIDEQAMAERDRQLDEQQQLIDGLRSEIEELRRMRDESSEARSGPPDEPAAEPIPEPVAHSYSLPGILFTLQSCSGANQISCTISVANNTSEQIQVELPVGYNPGTAWTHLYDDTSQIHYIDYGSMYGETMSRRRGFVPAGLSTTITLNFHGNSQPASRIQVMNFIFEVDNRRQQASWRDIPLNAGSSAGK